MLAGEVFAHPYLICHGRGDRSWVVHCLNVKAVGGEGYSRVLLAWHVKQWQLVVQCSYPYAVAEEGYSGCH